MIVSVKAKYNGALGKFGTGSELAPYRMFCSRMFAISGRLQRLEIATANTMRAHTYSHLLMVARL
jgi:hypothetical protein